MSGGVSEYTMANVVHNDGKYMESYLSNYSGYVYNDRLADFVFDTSGVSYPDDKYYDKYSYSPSYTTRKRSKLGDGIKEVYKGSSYRWYSDNSYLANYLGSWFVRGGKYSGNKGVFASDYESGGTNWGYYVCSTRFIITP